MHRLAACATERTIIRQNIARTVADIIVFAPLFTGIHSLRGKKFNVSAIHTTTTARF